MSHPRLRPVLALAAALGLLLALPAGPRAQAEPDLLELHVLFTADIHGHVGDFPATWMSPDFPPPIGGGASAATYIKKVRAEIAQRPNAALLILDAGDCWQGHPVGTLSEGKAVVDYFNHLDFDFVAMGNHEFDHGWEGARDFSLALNHKLVSCNTMKEGTDELVDWVDPYRIFERGGLRIGVIGAVTTGTAQMAFKDNIAGIEFAPIAVQAEKYRRILEDEKGCDIVFLVVHEGLPHRSRLEEDWESVQEESRNDELFPEDATSGLELAHVLPGIQVMFGGHTHQGYQEPWVDPYTHVLFFEPFARGTAVGHVVLFVDRRTGEVVDYQLEGRDGTLVSLFEDQLWPDPEMQAVLKPWVDKIESELQEVVGSSSVVLARSGRSNNPMGNFVTEAMRAAFEADLAFTNTGGLRTDIPSGPIRLQSLHELLPFGNSLVVVHMKGDEILRTFERKAGHRSSGIYFSGAQILVDPRQDEGQRVLEFTIGGEPIEMDKIYRVVTTDYLLEGNSAFDELPGIPDERVEYTQFLTRDAVVQYLEHNSPVSPRADDRFREEEGGQRAAYLNPEYTAGRRQDSSR